MSEDDSKTNVKEQSFSDWIRANKWKIVFALGILLFLFFWYFFVSDEDPELDFRDNEGTSSVTVPEQASTPVVRSGWKSDNFRINVALSYELPPDWTQSTETTPELNEYWYLRSPKDENGFYYCVDLLEYSVGSTNDFKMNADVVDSDPSFTAQGIFKSLNRIEYLPSDGSSGFHTTVIDDTSVQPGTKVDFTESIVNPEGRQLQVIGQYNCEETTKLTFDLPQYQDGLRYQEGIQIMSSLAY